MTTSTLCHLVTLPVNGTSLLALGQKRRSYFQRRQPRSSLLTCACSKFSIPSQSALTRLVVARTNHISQVLDVGTGAADLTPREVTQKLLARCAEVTRPTREWMEKHPKDKVAHDMKQFPGKLDHSSCLCLRVETFWHK
jgi:hypothetical protein